VTGYSGDAGDAIAASQHVNWISTGMLFSTPNSDNDAYAGGQCAANNGWWYRECSSSNVNKDDDGIWTIGSAVWNVQASHMLLKFN